VDFERVSAAYRTLGIQAQVVPFLYDMPAVLRTADLVVARAGAMTIAELTACGKAAVLIPLPTAIYDHQMKNARAMEAAGGAIVLPQADLSGMKLVEMIVAILSNPTRLSAMQSKSLEMRRIDAGEVIVNECYALMGVPHDINQSKKTAGG
jgi:UDP-N-acetylglucosamine--N-acetylmuramyl-(pentapeptide) pyrophosphoryl-undecaprenol N-acetylglucosamine transferase